MAAREKFKAKAAAGIVSDVRIVNGQRGRLAIFKLDDKSATIEATAMAVPELTPGAALPTNSYEGAPLYRMSCGEP